VQDSVRELTAEESPEPGKVSRPKNWMLRFSRFAALVCLGATAISLLARHWWLADLIANLRVQLIIGLIVATAGLVATRQNRLTALVMLALIWHGSWMTPYMFTTQKAVAIRPLRICVVNVLTQNRQHDKVLGVLKNSAPDVIAVLELGTDLESRLNEELGDLYRHRIAEPNDEGNFGIGLWSKLPLQDEQIFHLTVPLVPSISAQVNWEGQPVKLFATHPIPPMNARYFQARNRHLELLAQRVRQQDQSSVEGSPIVVGDLNLTPWSPWYGKFLADAGLTDCIAGDRMASLTPTWYRWPLFPFGLVLDHGFCGGGLRCTSRKVLEDIGSDHRPVLLEFTRQQDFSLQ
jgi:endonuclease/exonuclease/phosphatase (EEP) superfamily protein YafD